MHWLAAGLRLFGRAPVSFALLALAPIAIEAAVQQVPRVGVVASKLLVPWVGVGLWFGIDRLARGERMTARCLIEGFRAEHRAAAVASVIATMIVFATQLATSLIVYGDAVLALVTGKPSPVTRSLAFALVTLLPGWLPVVLLGLAPAFAAFDRMRPGAAILASLRAVARAPAAFAVFLAAQAALVALGLASYGIALVVILPWMSAALYVAYRDLGVGDRRAPRAP